LANGGGISPRPNSYTLYEIGRSWTLVEHPRTTLEMWCPVRYIGLKSRAQRFDLGGAY
jgi:hypothetical protein